MDRTSFRELQEQSEFLFHFFGFNQPLLNHYPGIRRYIMHTPFPLHTTDDYAKVQGKSWQPAAWVLLQQALLPATHFADPGTEVKHLWLLGLLTH